ncbi:MAG TPA: hypothetical protein VGJ05_03670 [Fimbriiglobus sp.]
MRSNPRLSTAKLSRLQAVVFGVTVVAVVSVAGLGLAVESPETNDVAAGLLVTYPT